jgi:hypothetical protein
MAEYMSKSTLLHLYTGDMDDPRTDGFAQAAQTAVSGLESIGPIADTIGKGTGPAHGGVWSGTGQPEASTTLRINRNALDVARIEMEAAKTAVHTLVNAMDDCQWNLRRFVQIAEGNNVDVAEDGTCTYRDPGKVPDGAGDPDLLRLTSTVKQILKIATLADLDARTSLQKVASNTPPTSDTADPFVLEQVNASLDQALEDKQSIEESAALWFTLQSPTWEDYLDGGGGDEATNQLLDAAVDAWTTLGPGNHSLITLLKDGPGGIVTSATQSIVIRLFDPEELVKKVTGPVAIGQVAAEAVLGVLSLWDKRDDPTTAVDTGGGAEVRVFDTGLAGIAAKFHPDHDDKAHDGGGTLADLTYYQRVTGTSADGTDWQDRAESTRAQLQAWVNGHPDAATPDLGYAKDLIAELDTALGG